MRQGIESIPSPKQQKRHSPSLLSLSFFNEKGYCSSCNLGYQAKRVLSNHLRSLVVEEGGRDTIQDLGPIHSQVIQNTVYR